MRRWRPQPSAGPWIALVLLIAALAAALWPARRIAAAFAHPPDLWQIDLGLYGWAVLLFGLVLLAAALLYRVAAALTLSYELDRNGLYIRWLGNRAIVPLEQIESIDAGVTGLRMPWGPLQRIGYWWGRAYDASQRPIHLFASASPASALLISTPDAGYLVSPDDYETFVQDLEQRRNLGATKSLAPTVQAGRMFLYEFWNDSAVRWLAVVATLLNLVTFAILAWRYPQLPGMLEMRFDATGQAADVRPRYQVLFLPLAAFGLLLVNLVLGLATYRRQQLGARLLQGASVIVQLLFFIALATIIR
jgi:hypothetical protein